ncbi:MAG: hypothetical protein JWM11_834 [Planctomycetaceae bacterium]|nr:hypothetical protein [Planctomycetaceae bacterium]
MYACGEHFPTRAEGGHPTVIPHVAVGVADNNHVDGQTALSESSKMKLFPIIFPPLGKRQLQPFQVLVGFNLDHPQVRPACPPFADHALRNTVLTGPHIFREPC